MKLTNAIATAAVTLTVGVAANTTTLATNTTTTTTTTASSPIHLFGIRSFQVCGVDIVGNDLRNERGTSDIDCLAKCKYNSINCNGVVWTDYNGGTCWVKKTNYQIPPTKPNTGAEGFFLAYDDGRSYIWSDVFYDVDMVGHDNYPTPFPSIAECRDDCSRNPACFGVVWTDYNGGTCYIKFRASTFVYKKGAQASFVARADRGESRSC